MRHLIWFSVAPRFRHNLCHAVYSSRNFFDKQNGGGSKMPQFSSWYSLIVLTSHVTSHPRSEIWTNSSFKVASLSPAQWILFVQFFLIAICGLKTPLRSTISLQLGSQKTLTMQSLLALILRSTCILFPKPIGSECRLSLLSSGPIVFASFTV